MQELNDFLSALRRWREVFMRRTMQNYMHYARQNGLSVSQANALFFLHRKGSAGVSDVGGDMGITSAAASQMLERLVQQGLILRSEDPHDRRLKHIVLSEKGRQLIHDGLREQQQWHDELAAQLSPAEQAQVAAALNLLVERVGLLNPSGDPEISKVHPF